MTRGVVGALGWDQDEVTLTNTFWSIHLHNPKNVGGQFKWNHIGSQTCFRFTKNSHGLDLGGGINSLIIYYGVICDDQIKMAKIIKNPEMD